MSLQPPTEKSLQPPTEKSLQPPTEKPAAARAGTDRFPTRAVVDILGISRRQLQYWAQTDLVQPSTTTPGGHRRYSFADLVALKAAKRLIDAGVSVQRIRSSIRALRHKLPEIERPLSELVLVATGDVVLVFHEGAAFEALSGQEWVFEVASFERELIAWQKATDDLPLSRARGSARVVRRRARPETNEQAG
jgi:DNA-binding transcriptional MerR regulator